MKKLTSGGSDMPFAMLLLAPSLLLLGGLVAWPMLSNIEISFLRLPLNPRLPSQFTGLENYLKILSDPGFWHSLWMTCWYTALVVAGSTALGLAVAIFFNREFRFRKTARSLVLLSYVTPSISLIFAWKYMFNNGYGVVNWVAGDLLHLYDQAPLWFDNPSSFALVVLFAVWRYFPYAFIPGHFADHRQIALRGGGDGRRQRLATVSHRDAARHHAGTGDRRDAAHHLDVLHVRGRLSADDQSRYPGRVSLQNCLCVQRPR